jgi:hypothetical protein
MKNFVGEALGIYHTVFRDQRGGRGLAVERNGLKNFGFPRHAALRHLAAGGTGDGVRRPKVPGDRSIIEDHNT